MRGRLLFLVAAVALAAAASGQARAGAATSACTATAAGRHTRQQVVSVRLSAGCPTGGRATGTLSFGQWPGIRGHSGFVLDYAARTLTLRVPGTISLRPAWRAHSADPALDLAVTASPKRRLSGHGSLTISGGFTASNGAVVRWQQTVRATPDKITLGAIHITASLPGTHRMVVEVHQLRQFCASDRACPFGQRISTETTIFPARFTRVRVDSALWFVTGNGTLLSGREQPTILLRAKRSGRILGRSDFQALIRVD
jgi:hypothetical protein